MNDCAENQTDLSHWLQSDGQLRTQCSPVSTSASDVIRETADYATEAMNVTYTPIGHVPLVSRASKYAKYVFGFAAVVVVGSLLVSDKSTTTSPLRSVTETAQTLNRMENVPFPGANDLITELHGKPDSYTSRLFSGYLPIGNGGQAFYFFAESQSAKPEDDPVLLWLNGGPGSSSLAGCFSEDGPLIVNHDGQSLRVNEYSWNSNANFLCIESPVGVGFSYNISGVYESDDLKQADELYGALQQFYVKFPWLRENDFIISGESYGGIYVPATAKRIVEGNLAGDEPKINLKKFVVGNGVNEFMTLSKVVYAYYHGLIGTEDYLSVREACPELKEGDPFPVTGISFECTYAMNSFEDFITSAGINRYHIYGKCVGKPLDGFDEMIHEMQTPSTGFPHPVAMTIGHCLESANLVTYFNNPAVRASMHTNKALGRWTDNVLTSANVDIDEFAESIGVSTEDALSKVLKYNSTLNSQVTTMWRYLLDHDVRGVIYYGDGDMICDFIGGLWAVESLQLPRKQSRQVWTVMVDGSEQVGGFYEDFGVLQYVTVKGAGHMVPQTNPVEAKKMLDMFVLNKVV
ncbi:hypothetical protein Poli38472_000687 [Pythium oligandrum]|uniref:Carboxypeptidase n=1 Tax=Pythium oligandrum TaxID=41045 RepID=A0A8K1FEK5_PYTOL|nr:hypothetical protein Poli38472_000687 [Pythium oligandrum]|eukprot:TMW60645.1 hypothetical protein Poli38472_000687 [Pythium oligandrum]